MISRLCRLRSGICTLATTLALAACQTPPLVPSIPPAPTPIPAPVPALPAQPYTALAPDTWEAIPGWQDDDLAAAWDAFIASCGVLQKRAEWQAVCAAATAVEDRQVPALRFFFESRFKPYHVVNADGSDSGTITGYYEPLLHGSRTSGPLYRYPMYGVPDDLLTIDLGELYPELKNMRLRGRLDGKHVVPYYTRAQIEDAQAPVAGKEIVWVDNPVELFFLEIQGSGRILLEDGTFIKVGYADQNGQPYRSVGKRLVDRGDLPLEKASMQGIKAWAARNPDKLRELLDYNTSYVFFQELPADAPGPLGSLGIALTARRSLAVDTRFIPLGAPVFLATTWPDSSRPLQQLMMAQDTGGAIRGAVRADFFWGFGVEAATWAGKMRQRGRMWVLMPADYIPPVSATVPAAQ